MCMNKYEIFKPFRQAVHNSWQTVLEAARNAEDEVVYANKYWKASDTLDRLLILIRRSQRSVERAYADCQKRAEEAEKAEAVKEQNVPAPEKRTAEIEDRWDKREELENRDPFEKGNWNKF